MIVDRVAALPQHCGVSATEPLLGPVTAAEAEGFGVPPGSPIPSGIKKVVDRTLAAPPDVLVGRGIVSSAEAFAETVAGFGTKAVAAAYGDERLRTLTRANYDAFRNRRSVLLTDLVQQVTFDELPWVRAVARFRHDDAETTAEAWMTLVHLAELTLDAFPGTIIPNPLVAELDALSRAAGLTLPLVKEIAADISLGSFSGRFLEAAKCAGDLLRGSLYERYYDIDYARICTFDDVRRNDRCAAPTSPSFDAYCIERAGVGWEGWSVVHSGTVVEQAQIVTTHNLATLTGPYGVGEAMSLNWSSVARKSFGHAVALNDRLRSGARPLRRVKDLAYAWRQTIFCLTRMDAADVDAFLAWAHDKIEARSEHVVAVMGAALSGLADVVRGGTFDVEGRSESGRRLLGWTVTPHWVLEAAGVDGPQA